MQIAIVVVIANCRGNISIKNVDEKSQLTGISLLLNKSLHQEWQLREKLKEKPKYGLHERQFRRFMMMAQRTREPTGAAMLKLLERRLDNVVYRLGFARSRPQARQFVSHGLVQVDGRRVNIPSYILTPGQVVELKETVLKIPDVVDLAEQKPYVPEWLERRDGGGQVVREPRREEIDQDINERLIVEFYSR